MDGLQPGWMVFNPKHRDVLLGQLSPVSCSCLTSFFYLPNVPSKTQGRKGTSSAHLWLAPRLETWNNGRRKITCLYVRESAAGTASLCHVPLLPLDVRKRLSVGEEEGTAEKCAA